MKYLTLVLLSLLYQFQILYAQGNSNLIISEVMFNAPSGNNEFIELYNKSETEYINLTSYRIKYYTSNPDSIISAGWGTVLPPKSFAVIFEGDYNFSSGIYNNIVPSNALKMKISDNAFGSNGMSNTTDRPLALINIRDTVDYYKYSANNSNGFSDEKIILNNDTSAQNWANSLRHLGSPGYKNSVSPSLNDIAVTGLTIFPLHPLQGEQANIRAVSKNLGYNTSGEFTINIYNDINLDSLAEPSELIYSQNYSTLPHDDSVLTETALYVAQPGKYNIICKAVYGPDEDTLNNTMMNSFTAYQGGGFGNKIVINEIMYAPESGSPEWVELYNKSQDTINIKKWKVSDNSTTAVITTKSKLIYPLSYVVLTKDTSINTFFHYPIDIVTCSLPQLNNSGDRVVIKDSLFEIIDSLDYLPEWGGNNNGLSLERIDTVLGSTVPINWGTTLSIFKGTPGRINSLTPKNNDLWLCEIQSPPYGILNEWIDVVIKVKNEGFFNSGSYIINLYDDANNDSLPQVQELLQSKPDLSLQSKDSTDFIFHVKITRTGTMAFIGEIVVTPDQDPYNNIRYAKTKGITVNEQRGDIVINEIMYAPETGRPEFVELYNKSNKVINLKNYYIADNSDSTKAVLSSINLSPKEYIVIASDSSIIKYYAIPSKVVISNFPSLNNTGDKVLVTDSLFRVIDSLQYYPSWGGSKGASLERISCFNNSLDSSNWKGSISKYKGTPGYINSVSEKRFDVETAGLVFTPEYPVKGDTVSLKVKVFNRGTEAAFINASLFEDVDFDSTADIEWESLHDVFIPSKDSALISFHYTITNLQQHKAFFAFTDLQGDEDTTNNYVYSSITPGVIPATIIINEIMYCPSGGEPEWIELYNKSSEDICLKDWRVSDVITTPSVHRITDSVIIKPLSYLVLTSDSSIYNYHLEIPGKVLKMSMPSLNNTGDGVVIKDDRNITIDSLLFNNTWGGAEGHSLERISPDEPSKNKNNWQSADDIEGSTPGRINSRKKKLYDLSVSQIIFNPRFPVPGDNISLSAQIKNNGSHNAENASISYGYLTNSGDIIRGDSKDNISLASYDSADIYFSSTIPGIQDSITVIVKINSSPDEDTINNTLKRILVMGAKYKSVVINEIMYDPLYNEPEWVELYNPSDSTINLKNWIISDIISPAEGIISDSDLFLNGGEHLVISPDTSFSRYYPDPSIKNIQCHFGTLGNVGDGIILYDFRKGIIDSVYYISSWLHKKGYSIERFSPYESSNDSTNWILSVGTLKCTPGKRNSVSDYKECKANDLVINEIMFDPSPGNSEYIEIYNKSDKVIDIGGWIIEDKYNNKKRMIDSSLSILPSEYFLAAADSSLLSRFNLYSFKNKNIFNENDLGLTMDGIICLKDIRNKVIDSVHYSDHWHNKNSHSKKDRSLERINPSIAANEPGNWGTSVNISGGTPGSLNSIFLENNNTAPELTVSPNPFSPDNDGYEDVGIINYRFKFPLSSLLFKIYDSKGRLVKTINSNYLSEAQGSAVYNGNGDDNIPLRIGIYILVAEGRSMITNENQVLKTVFVIARKLN